jgi:hypothetical protein
MDADWRFFSGASTMMGAFSAGEQKGISVELPHDAMIHRKRDPQTPNAHQTGFYPGGHYTYLKQWDVPQSMKGSTLMLQFEGIADRARIYINDDFVASSVNPYAETLVDVTGYLHYGESNEVKVEVSSVEQSSRWYSGAGIYRHVNLLVGDPVYIVPLSTHVVTREVSSDAAELEISTSLRNDSELNVPATVLITLVDPDGLVATSETESVTMFAHDRQHIHKQLTVVSPRLWSDESPSLYTCRVEVLQGSKPCDAEFFRMGIRRISLNAEQGLCVNGRSVKLRGACVHHDNGVIGSATLDDAEYRRCRQLKEAGFNALRSSHHPMSRALLSACDELGLYVIDELSDVWTRTKNPNDYANFFPSQWHRDVRSMVSKDFNHPSVIIYSTGNEIPEAGSARGAQLNRDIDAAIKRLDDTRYTVNAINGLLAGSSRLMDIVQQAADSLGISLADMHGQRSNSDDSESTEPQGTVSKEQGQSGGADSANAMAAVLKGPLADAIATSPLLNELIDEFASGTDIAGYNYLTALHEVKTDRHPNRVVLGTETFPADIVHLWDVVKRHANVIGDMTWAGYDYIGEAGCGIFHYDGAQNFSAHWPDRLAGIGDLDILGRRKPISHLRESVYGLTHQPSIAVLRMDRPASTVARTPWMWKDNIESWTWPGFEGQSASVDVYANADEVELSLNGEVVGKKPVSDSFVATFDVPYHPGTLSAVSYVEGKRVGQAQLQTAGTVSALRLDIDKSEIMADGQALDFVTIHPVDADGRENRWQSVPVSVTVEGAGELQGFGSADPSCEGNYWETTWSTYDGEVMAVLRSGHTSGTLTIKVRSPGCPDVVGSINVVEPPRQDG